MRLSDETYEFIKGEVVALFERYDVRCIPINGFELAIKIGIKLIPYSALSEQKLAVVMRASPDGLYVETMSGQDIIYYNDNDISYKRINMTILHEIGHCVLDHTGFPAKKEEEEAEACFFAKYASAPPPLVHQESPSCPEELADIFDISFTAACYAFDYYHKWLIYGESDYTEYELRLLSLFESA